MLITAIQIRRMENSTTKMRGVASINLDNMVVIHEIKVLKADGKCFLAMPSRQTKVGTFKDMVHPINAVVREAFETLIIGGYEKAEKEGYSKIELTYTGSEKNNLTEQTMEDFSVHGESGNYMAIVDSEGSSLSEKLTPKSDKKVIDESLLKWLES